MFVKQLDIVSIGDIATDAFIRLKDAHVHAEVNHESRELCMSFGSKIPFEYVKVVKAVGNAGNAAVAAARLGLRSAIVTSVGDDQNGKDCLSLLKASGVSDRFVRIEKNRATNYHFVLWFGEERTILVNHASFDYGLPRGFSQNSALGLPPKWIYLTSLSSNSFAYAMEIADYLEAHPRIKLAFQPGTFQIQLGHHRLKRLYERADLVIVNREEAGKILEEESATEPKTLLTGLSALGPKLVAVTDGTAGSYFYDGEHYYHVPIFPDPRPALERTGCGDAWSSTFVSALAKGLSPLEALSLSPINAMSVAQFIGSQEGLLSWDQLTWWQEQAPLSYRPREI